MDLCCVAYTDFLIVARGRKTHTHTPPPPPPPPPSPHPCKSSSDLGLRWLSKGYHLLLKQLDSVRIIVKLWYGAWEFGLDWLCLTKSLNLGKRTAAGSIWHIMSYVQGYNDYSLSPGPLSMNLQKHCVSRWPLWVDESLLCLTHGILYSSSGTWNNETLFSSDMHPSQIRIQPPYTFSTQSGYCT